MDPEFWQQRWQQGRIGFHLPDINPWLQTYIEYLDLPEAANILLPLCGKSLDMLWLAEQGFHVTGIEVSRLAVEDFFTENQLDFELIELPSGILYRSDKIHIYCADYFDVDLSRSPAIDAIYDRAALIAMPAQMRPKYAQRLLEILPAGKRILLITLDYPQEQMTGPPFAVSSDEVALLFSQNCEIEALVSDDVLQKEPRFLEKGLQRMYENVFVLKNVY